MNPKAFISYSWTSESHRERVREWADRLLADGVAVVLDQYDLKEGHDKYAFMEQMVTDPSVTHVLVICDQAYAEKADARKAGVGTESQIISQELYNRIEQTKFVPILCEFSATGEPHLPTFMKSRIGINFSSPESVNDNWEQLVRLLFGKPLYQKPAVGKPPVYISEDKTEHSNPAISKFATYKHALMQGKRGIAIYREDFMAACFQYADNLRVRKQPDMDRFAERVLKDCETLVEVRDIFVDWVLLEVSILDTKQFQDTLSSVLEKLLALRSRPGEVTTWNDVWFEAHRLFVYETFLYIVAALLKVGAFEMLHEVFSSSYLGLDADSINCGGRFLKFDDFFASSQTLGSVLAPPGQRLYSSAAALLKRNATRTDLTFESVMEAELLVFLMVTLYREFRWYPQTLFYAGYGRMFPLFLRATQHKHFQKLSIITGIATGDEFRSKVKEGLERMKMDRWVDFAWSSNVSFWVVSNMDKWVCSTFCG